MSNAMTQLRSLTFNEQIAPKAGKPLSIAELLKRLKALQGELAKLEQEEVDKQSLQRVTKELVSTNLLTHKDKGVRAYTAACLADILKLHAPDAPYTVSQLRSIFEFFVQQLKGLDSKDSPYFPQCFYLLESLSSVKSIVLVSDLPNAEELMARIFQMFFDIIKPDSPKNVEFHMADILVQLIDEAPTIPAEVVEYILAQFLRSRTANDINHPKDPKQGSLILTIPPAYNLAKQVCQQSADRLQRRVCQYFSDVIYDASGNNISAAPSDEDIEELRKAHYLVRELWKAAPQVLSNVIPLLEQEMLAEITELRILSTEALGEMAAETMGGVNFALEYPTTWSVWLKKANDKSSSVRCHWLDACVKILQNRSDDTKPITDALSARLIDQDEKVRVAACMAIGKLDFQTITLKLGESIFSNLADRIKDRKHSVRSEGMKVLGTIFNQAYKHISNGEDAINRQLGWIPSKILECFYVNDKDVNVLIERVLFEYILPMDIDDKARCERLLWVIKGLEEKSEKAFYAIPMKQVVLSQAIFRFLQFCEKYEGGSEKADPQVRRDLETAITWMANGFPDQVKAANDFRKLAVLNDRRLYRLMRECMQPESTFKSVKKCIREIGKRIEQAGSSPSETVQALLMRCSLLIFNKSNIPTVVDISRRPEHQLNHTAHEVLKHISVVAPAIFKSHAKGLAEELSTVGVPNPTSGNGNLDHLKTLASFAASYPQDVPYSIALEQNLMEFAKKGSPQEAKYATKILLQAEKKGIFARDLTNHCMDIDLQDEHLLSKLSALSQLFLLAPEETKPAVEIVTNIVIQDILLATSQHVEETDVEWVEDDEVDRMCTIKLLALRVLVNRLRAEETDEESGFVVSVLKLLNALIANGGEMTKTESTPHKSRLRLEAARSLLKLATAPTLAKRITPVMFNRFALLAQDTCFQVRQTFVRGIMKRLASGRLPRNFYTILFLVAFEPEEDLKNDVSRWLRAKAAYYKSAKSTIPQHMFPRLLHLLSHHPDLTNETENLLDFAQYVMFYLHAIATEDSLSLIFYLAQRVKQARDALSAEHSEKLYVISDLAQLVIRRFEEAHGWSMQSWPVKEGLPTDLFASLSSSSLANEIAKTKYTPSEIESKLDAVIKVKSKPSRKRKSTDETGNDKKSSKAAGFRTPLSKKKIKAVLTPPSERRKSSRPRAEVNYVPSDDEIDGNGSDKNNESELDTGSDKEN